jgi:hypothetical protein
MIMVLCDKCEERPAARQLWDKSAICEKCFDETAEAVAVQAVRRAGKADQRGRQCRN